MTQVLGLGLKVGFVPFSHVTPKRSNQAVSGRDALVTLPQLFEQLRLKLSLFLR